MKAPFGSVTGNTTCPSPWAPVTNRAPYGVTTGLSPEQMYRYDIASGQGAQSGESPYWGDYAMGSSFQIHPDGTTIYTSSGDVFLSAASPRSDMTYLGKLGQNWDDLAFSTDGTMAYALRSKSSQLAIYHTATLSQLHTYAMSAPAERILRGDG